jgi:adenine-specific DNA-methyltransferase
MPQPHSVDLRHAYLSRQLIAYIGNKRRLLPLIHGAITAACGESGAGLTFLDPFAGSGVVSRLAKLMGFRVLSNDWEVFARIINTAHVATDATEAASLFADAGGLASVLRDLAAPGDPEDLYVSRYYAPSVKDPAAADYRRERLFYTQANALAIDRIRSRIERRYPLNGTERRQRQRALLIAPLLYEAATHTNTSGVFKACHKGFGGHGRDALTRILAPIELEEPVLVDAAERSQIFQEDANHLVRRVEADVAYLDPPYATHQYGSNYHLLTSIALWDFPPAPLDLDGSGVLKRKAGIRPDWVKTRSAYCRRATAADTLADLLQGLRARWILLSYSSEGLVPFETLLDLCSARGSVTVRTNEYTTYPGGKQSNGRAFRNVETVLMVDTRRAATAAVREVAARALELRRTMLLFRRRYDRERLDASFAAVEGGSVFRADIGGHPVRLTLLPDGRLCLPGDLEDLDGTGLRSLRHRLEPCACKDTEEELAVLWRMAGEGPGPTTLQVREMLRALRRLAHRKNRPSFERWLGELRSMARDGAGSSGQLGPGLDQIEAQARRRWQG